LKAIVVLDLLFCRVIVVTDIILTSRAIRFLRILTNRLDIQITVTVAASANLSTFVMVIFVNFGHCQWRGIVAIIFRLIFNIRATAMAAVNPNDFIVSAMAIFVGFNVDIFKFIFLNFFVMESTFAP
jgi:hypothetical protein